MLFPVPFPSLNEPLTQARLDAILRAARCTLRLCFDHVHVYDQTGFEFHVCLCEDLKTWDVQAFIDALSQTLAIRVEESVGVGIQRVACANEPKRFANTCHEIAFLSPLLRSWTKE